MRQQERALEAAVDAASRERAAVLREVADTLTAIVVRSKTLDDLATALQGLPFKLRFAAERSENPSKSGDPRMIRHSVTDLDRFRQAAQEDGEATGRALGLRDAARLGARALAGIKDPAVRRFLWSLEERAASIGVEPMYEGDRDRTKSRP